MEIEGKRILVAGATGVLTGFADRALSGTPPRLPEPGDHHAVARQILDALRENRRELAYDVSARRLVAG